MQTDYELLENGIKLFRGGTAFPLSTDAVLLADFAAVPKGAAVCDLCAGAGALGLLLLDRDPSLSVTALELRAEPCALMERSRAENALGDRFRVLRGDVRAVRQLLPHGSFRQVVCNPPYYPVGSGFAPADETQAVARTELCCALREAGLEPKTLRPVCPRPDSAPSLLLLRSVKGGKPGLAWLPPLILSNPDGTPTAEYRRIYRMT